MMRIDKRFCGPPGTGNGGYVSGRLASLLAQRAAASASASPGAVEVTLRAPTPLDTDLPLTLADQSAALHTADGTLLAEAACVPTLLPFEPSPVSFEEASEASERFIGFHDHPYPGCFVCGLERAAGLEQGLALHPGALQAQGTKKVVAAPFRPAADLCDERGLLEPEFVWAALDCPSWFGHAAFQQRSAVILLGRLAVQVLRRPRADEACVVQGFGLGQEGRRIICGSALYGEDRDVIAYSRSTWIELKSGQSSG